MSDELIDLTRRKALLGLGAIGAAGAGAGMGTSALFSDEESFSNNSIQAGELNLVVDYYTSRDQGQAGTSSQSGEIDGNPGNYSYSVSDAKPGDSGMLAFCPKVVDNPGYVWAGSVDGVTDYEKGQTEPEGEVDATVGGTLGNATSGAGAGDLSEVTEVTVKYVDGSISSGSFTNNGERVLNNPSDYKLADLAKDLESGFQLDGDEPNDGDGPDPYPASSDADDQQGPCLVIEWEIPADVGNEIQSDALDLDISFAAVQERNNPSAANPFVDVTVGPSGGSYDFNSIQAAIDDSGTSAGDVISVAPDKYTEDVTVDKDDLLLVSTGGPSVTTIDGQAVVSGNGAALCGFTVSPPPATSNQTGEALRVSNSPDDVVIMNNIVEDFEHVPNSNQNSTFDEDLSAINVFGGTSGDPIENVTVANNTVRRIDGPSDKGSVGISIQGNIDGATVRNNIVSKVGEEESSYAFGITIRGTGNHGKLPRNIDVIDNDISTVLASDTTPYLGVGFGVEADGTNYLFRDNTIDDVNIGVELKGAATELALTGNSISNINPAVNNNGFVTSGIPDLYLGDFTDNAPLGTFIADNSYDVAVKSDGSFGPIDQFGTTYPQAIVPQ